MKQKNIIIVIIVLIILAAGGWFAVWKVKNKPNPQPIAEQIKDNKELKNFSLSGVVTETGVNSFQFYTGIVRKTDTGTRPVFETKTVIVSDKTAIEKQGIKEGTLKLSDIVKGAKITVFASTNPFDAKEITADKIQIESQ
jgi:hypothetical protein